MEAMRELCSEHVSGELVGGVELDTFDKARTIFGHAHMVMSTMGIGKRLGFGGRPWWKLAEYEGEPIVLGFRTLDGLRD
jgi:hypothetical protein